MDAKPFQSYSTEQQDQFVNYVTKGMTKGFFVDIGCRHPIQGNNTYALEKDFEWSGILIDQDVAAIEECRKVRSFSRCFAQDIITNPLSQKIAKLFPMVIDYVSFDVDEANDYVIQDWNFTTWMIRCFTYEHDTYRRGPRPAQKAREIFRSHGYFLVCEDVCNVLGQPFEDWWVHPDLLPKENYERIISKGKIHRDIFVP